jgi:Ser/Thr protein kinase RdoA (MazF antagonist)
MNTVRSLSVAVPPIASDDPSGKRADFADVAARPERLIDGDVGHSVVDGRRWVHRGPFGRTLALVPAQAWSDPVGQGWQLVKQNSRRTVWRAEIRGASYYVKYYAGDGWRGALRRLLRRSVCQAEWNSGMFALRCGIAAVRPAGYTDGVRVGGASCALLVTEAIEPAYPLSEFWGLLARERDARRRRRAVAQLCELLGELIARAHQSGFEHRDMHADNILVHALGPGRYRAAFVDLHSARLGVPISDRAVVRNLAQLNQWFRRTSSVTDRLRFLRAYFRWRNELETAFPHGHPLGFTFDQIVPALERSGHRHAERLWAKRDRRMRRNGRYFARVRAPGGWRGMVYLRSKHGTDESPAASLRLSAAWWAGQLRDPLSWFDPRRGSPCKDSHSASVARGVLRAPEQADRAAGPDAAGEPALPAIIKRPRARDWRRQLRMLFGESRSMRAWRLGYELLHRDLPTARPLAVLERRAGPLVLDSVLLTEALPGAIDLEAFLRRGWGTLGHCGARSAAGAVARGRERDWFLLKREVSRLLVREVRRLQERGFAHRDCKPQNLLVLDYPRRRLVWIDLDGVRRVGRLSRAQEIEPLIRLHVGLLEAPGLTRTDRLRFLKAWCARYASPRDWRTTWRQVASAAERKLRRQSARRAWKLQHYGRA